MRTATAAQIMAGEKDAQITAVEMTTTVAAVLTVMVRRTLETAAAARETAAIEVADALIMKETAPMMAVEMTTTVAAV